mgnify:CR=1 FL=1
MEYITIIIFAVFVNNVILSQFLGICPFLGVSTKVSTAAGMGAAVVFVMTLSTIVTFLLQKFVLVCLKENIRYHARTNYDKQYVSSSFLLIHHFYR